MDWLYENSYFLSVGCAVLISIAIYWNDFLKFISWIPSEWSAFWKENVLKLPRDRGIEPDYQYMQQNLNSYFLTMSVLTVLLFAGVLLLHFLMNEISI